MKKKRVAEAKKLVKGLLDAQNKVGKELGALFTSIIQNENVSPRSYDTWKDSHSQTTYAMLELKKTLNQNVSREQILNKAIAVQEGLEQERRCLNSCFNIYRPTDFDKSMEKNAVIEPYEVVILRFVKRIIALFLEEKQQKISVSNRLKINGKKVKTMVELFMTPSEFEQFRTFNEIRSYRDDNEVAASVADQISHFIERSLDANYLVEKKTDIKIRVVNKNVHFAGLFSADLSSPHRYVIVLNLYNQKYFDFQYVVTTLRHEFLHAKDFALKSRNMDRLVPGDKHPQTITLIDLFTTIRNEAYAMFFEHSHTKMYLRSFTIEPVNLSFDRMLRDANIDYHALSKKMALIIFCYKFLHKINVLFIFPRRQEKVQARMAKNIMKEFAKGIDHNVVVECPKERLFKNFEAWLRLTDVEGFFRTYEKACTYFDIDLGDVSVDALRSFNKILMSYHRMAA